MFYIFVGIYKCTKRKLNTHCLNACTKYLHIYKYKNVSLENLLF